MQSQEQPALLLAAYDDFIGFAGDPSTENRISTIVGGALGGEEEDPDEFFTKFLASLKKYHEAHPAVEEIIIASVNCDEESQSDQGDDGPDESVAIETNTCCGGSETFPTPGAGIEFSELEPEWLDPLSALPRLSEFDGGMDESTLEEPTFTEVLVDDVASDAATADDEPTTSDEPATSDAATASDEPTVDDESIFKFVVDL